MRRNPWLVLAVLAVAQFVVVLDITIVNVAAPHIQAGLHFSTDNLQWVISAYTLMFGGFLLLGGRAADLLGRRRLFVAGLVLFGAASLAAGLAPSSGALIAIRGVQGLGGSMLSPAALSLLTVTFAHGRQRSLALGIWGALAGLGGTLGVVAGGVLVDALSWRWVFYVNVPIVAAVAIVTPFVIAESRVPGDGRRSFDVRGALLSTAGLLAIVYGVVRAATLGWGSAEVLACVLGGIGLLGVFVLVESRSPDPLVPLSLFRSRALSASSGALALNGGGFLGMFFVTSIYLERVRGESALHAGLQFLPMGFAAIVAATVASQLVPRVGTRTVQLAGTVLSVAGLVLLTGVGAHSSYAGGLLPGLVLFGAGIISVGVPAQITAVADFSHRNAGTASGVVTTFYQVGGAVGLAVVTTLSDTRVTSAITHGATQLAGLLDGFHRGLVVAAVYAVVNVAFTVGAPSLRPTAEQMVEVSAAA